MTETIFRPLHWLVAVTVLLYAPVSQADLSAVIARAKPSLVTVGTFKETDSPRFRLRGTGFVVGDGTQVVTNAHVLPESKDDSAAMSVGVRVEGGSDSLQIRQASLIEVDKVHDLALFKITGRPLTAMVLGNSDLAKEGQSVAFTGFPIGGALGFSPVTHRGMISSITAIVLPTATAQTLNERTIRSLRTGSFDIFQLDAIAYPGNSGGPVYDVDTGEVLGVINMAFVKATKESALTSPSGITYAIPSKFISDLLKRAEVK